MSDVDRMLWITQEIQRDMEADTARREGQAFTGANVAAALGELAGTIAGLAGVVERLVLMLPPDAAEPGHGEGGGDRG